MSDVFISYASQDRDSVKPLVEALEEHGWSVWWDRQIGAGTEFDREIEKALDDSKCIVVVWSQAALESNWVRNEANEGLERNVLVPVAIETVRPPLAFRRLQTIDLNASPEGIGAIIEAVNALVPRAPDHDGAHSPFVGRDAELDRIHQMLARVAGGSGSGTGLLLSGEAGVGKTRLSAEISTRAQQLGFSVLRGHCPDMDGAPPYQPLIEQIDQAGRDMSSSQLREMLGENAPEVAKLIPELRQRFDDIAEPISLPPEEERRYLLHGVGEFVARLAQQQPLMLLFEDLHWADDSTCVLLRHLTDRLRDAPVMIIGTYRDTDLDSSRPFTAKLQELLRERLVEDVLLQRLERDNVSALLDALAGKQAPLALVDLVYSETEGNPFFVEEVYRHLHETGKLFDEAGDFHDGIQISDTDVPRGLRLVIRGRIDRVSDTCRAVLSIAAVVGKNFSFEVLRRAGGTSEDELLEAIEEADEATLIEDLSRAREARYGFVHEQIRQTLLNALSFPRRQRLHLRIGEALDAIGNVDAGEISHHLYQAGAAADLDKTLHYLQLTADRSLDAYAFEDALRQLDMVLAVLPEDDHRQHATVHGKRATALRGAARIDDALAALSTAIEMAGDSSERDQLRFQRSQLLVDLYRGADAEPDLTSLFAEAKAGDDRRWELKVQVCLARAHYVLSLDHPEYMNVAAESHDRAIAVARELGDTATLASCLIATNRLLSYGTDSEDK